MIKIAVGAFCLFVVACPIDPLDKNNGIDSAPIKPAIDVMAVPNAVPKYEKRTRAGNPVEYEVLGKRYTVLPDSHGYKEQGIASWYGTKFHGRKTANGEIYDMYAMTAAHTTLPIPSYVRVTHLKNQHSVIVRINDRGPFHGNRLIDLSYAAAVKLGIQQLGTSIVEVSAIQMMTPTTTADIKNSPADKSIFYIQVGAFSSRFNAEQLQEKLTSGNIKNAAVKIAVSQVDSLYKVRIGPFYTDEQTEMMKEKLANIGLTNYQLIVEK